MIDEARRGAFALSARNADGLRMELTEKQVGLRSDFHAFRVEAQQRYAWGLDDDVIVVHGLKITCAKILHSLHFVFVGHCHNGIGQVFVQETQCRPALASKT